MKKLFITLLLFCFYVTQAWPAMIIQQFTASGCGGGAVVCSDLEDSADRAQWTTGAGTPDYDHSSAGLSMTGSYVLRLDAAEYAYLTPPASDNLYMVFQYRIEDNIDSVSESFAQIQDTVPSGVCYAYIERPGDGGKIYVDNGGTLSTKITNNCGTDATCWIKFYYRKSTGGDNGVCGITYWNGSAWASATQTTNGSDTTQAQRAYVLDLQDGAGLEYQYFDQVHLFTSDYTGDPTTL